MRRLVLHDWRYQLPQALVKNGNAGQYITHTLSGVGGGLKGWFVKVVMILKCWWRRKGSMVVWVVEGDQENRPSGREMCRCYHVYGSALFLLR